MAALEVGSKAPVFSAPNQEGQTLRLKDFSGKTVVLYFYPKDDTPGCTKEACSFRDGTAALKKKGAVVLGVSPDGPASHAKFIRKHALTFDLLADEDHAIAEAYGVWVEKSMYGKKYMGVERSTFVIGPDGRIRAIFRKVKPEGHADEVLAGL
jgi:peroxiredoxin Q/BCP